MRRLFLALCLIATGLLLGDVLLRGSVPIDQTPALAWDAATQLVIHRPHQSGVRYPDHDLAHPVRYTINADGWNSVFPDYAPASVTHEAILIGDSFVEALQVDPQESVAWRLQGDLPAGWTVYPMGMSGAPLSQYLQMARVAVAKYHPAILVIVLVHNDFLESYERPDNPLYASFWHTNGVRMEGPVVYQPRPWSEWMASEWATRRLALQLLGRWLQPASMAEWQMGIDVEKNLAQKDETARTTDYLFGQFALLKQKTSLLFVMDGPRDLLETGEQTLQASPVFHLNETARRLAAAHGLRFFDLSPVFRDDWIAHRHPFSFPQDYHWNKYAHDLVARYLVPLVVQQ